MAVPNKPDVDRLITKNLHLVGHAVAHVSSRFPRHVDREELWNAGALGLVEAAQRFDVETGIPFPRYAKIRIRGAIIDSTRTRDWASRSVRRKAREVEEVTKDLRGDNGRDPSQEQVAAALGVSTDEVDAIRARSATSMLLYLDHENGEHRGPSLRDSIVDPGLMANPDVALEHREMLGTLVESVDRLPGIHCDVIRRYYLEGEPLQDIANDLGVTQARVSQIRSEALNSLRAHFSSLYEGTPEVDDEAPGKRARAAYLAQLANQSTWRSRMDAADESPTVAARMGA